MNDILACIVLLLIGEFLLLKERYIALSPLALMCGSVLAVYISQFWLMGLPYDQIGLIENLTELDNQTLELLKASIRLSFYTFTVLVIAGLSWLSRSLNHEWRSLKAFPSTSLSILTLLILAPLVFAFLGLGVGFSPSRMLDRALHSRSYTYIKTGYGPIMLLRAVFLQIAAFASFLSLAHRPKNPDRILCCLTVVFLAFLGGSKINLVWNVVLGVLVIQKVYFRSLSSTLSRLKLLLFGGGTLFGVLIFAFFIIQKPGEVSRLEHLREVVYSYPKEAYYTARVLSDFTWKPEYTELGIRNTLLVPVPRSIYPEKELELTYNKRFWRKKYESFRPIFHTTTYGCLAEAHMMFGKLGPLVYGTVWALIVVSLYATLLTTRSMYVYFAASYLAVYIFYFFRAGFLFTNFWYWSIAILLAYVPLSKQWRISLWKAN